MDIELFRVWLSESGLTEEEMKIVASPEIELLSQLPASIIDKLYSRISRMSSLTRSSVLHHPITINDKDLTTK